MNLGISRTSKHRHRHNLPISSIDRSQVKSPQLNPSIHHPSFPSIPPTINRPSTPSRPYCHCHCFLFLLLCLNLTLKLCPDQSNDGRHAQSRKRSTRVPLGHGNETGRLRVLWLHSLLKRAGPASVLSRGYRVHAELRAACTQRLSARHFPLSIACADHHCTSPGIYLCMSFTSKRHREATASRVGSSRFELGAIDLIDSHVA